MRRYFYNEVGMISKWLEKNALAKSYEDSLYRSAFLAALRNDPSGRMEQVRELVLEMTMAEQDKYANNRHLEGLFTLFSSLHRYSRGRTMLSDALNQASTALVDPDKFPIWDLKKYRSVYQSQWGMHLAELRHDLGFHAIIRDSQVEHAAGGRGAYLILPEGRATVPVGQLLGLVPGKIFASFNDFKSISLKERKEYHRDPQHIHFPTGKILELADLNVKPSVAGLGLSTDLSSEKVDATFHNPYAFGHMINHPPPGCEANVVFSEIRVGASYLPKYLLRFLPYEDYTANRKEVTLFGVFAVREIEHKEELFVNYNESHIYPIDALPEWLIQPPAHSPIFAFLNKGEYEIPESGFWRVIERRALSKNKELLKKYEEQVRLRPGAVEFEQGGLRYKRMKIRLEEENEYDRI